MAALATIVATALLAPLLGGISTAASPAETIRWSTHIDQNCGIELKYPTSYQLNPSGAKDSCALSILLGMKETRGVRWLVSLNVTEMHTAYPRTMLESGSQPSAAEFALYLAKLQCQADGPEGSTYCTEGEIRSTFKTPQGLEGYEIYLTEVHESFASKKILKRAKGPIFALDLFNDETGWILLAEASRDHLATLRAIVDNVRVWRKPRRHMPQVAELRPFSPSGQPFNIRVTSTQASNERVGPPHPPVKLFLTDPRGRRLGEHPATKALHAEIPAITYSGWGEAGVGLRELVEGRYQLEVTGMGASLAYQLAVQAPDQTGKLWTSVRTGRTAEPGAIDRYELIYSRTSAPAATLSEAKDLSEMTMLLSGPDGVVAELLVTDPQGRTTGRDPVTRLEYRKISRSSYLNEGSQDRTLVLRVRQPMEGSYVLRVSGTNGGTYSLDIRARDLEGITAASPLFRDVPTGRDNAHLYLLEYQPSAKTALKVSGGFDGGGEKPTDLNKFLTYANPTGRRIRLEAGVNNFPLLIYYGASIQPTSFNATMNDSNISGWFTPSPDQHELVKIPLKRGSNRLSLSVQGLTTNGQTAKDTDEFVFLVQ